MSTETNPREQELLKEGWTKQFCAGGSRLREAAELYESMGLEVHLEPARAEDLGCSECLPGPGGAFEHDSVLYTRPRKEGKTPYTHKQDEDLW